MVRMESARSSLLLAILIRFKCIVQQSTIYITALPSNFSPATQAARGRQEHRVRPDWMTYLNQVRSSTNIQLVSAIMDSVRVVSNYGRGHSVRNLLDNAVSLNALVPMSLTIVRS